MHPGRPNCGAWYTLAADGGYLRVSFLPVLAIEIGGSKLCGRRIILVVRGWGVLVLAMLFEHPLKLFAWAGGSAQLPCYTASQMSARFFLPARPFELR